MLGSTRLTAAVYTRETPIGAASNDDGSVMAFASWGTEFHDWPEVMVFNRNVELIGQIDFPGSAFQSMSRATASMWWAARRRSTPINLAVVGASS